MAHGGKYVPVQPRTRKINDINKLTHIIAENSRFPQYFDAFDALKNIVKSAWVDESIAKNKAANPRLFSPDPALFLSEVVVFCADLPEADKEAIAGGVLAMGGRYSDSLTKFVTHIVALNFESEACVIAVKKNLKCKVVLPHW
jgi:hypothetical protein